MKKVLIALCAVSVAFGAVACSKDKSETRTAAAATAVANEAVTQIEALYQYNDPKAADPNTALTCKYVKIVGGNRVDADAKTAGKCDFASLQGQAASKGAVSDAVLANVMDAISSVSNAPASAGKSINCVAYNLKTTTRSVGLQDCSLSDASKASESDKAAAAAQITKILGL